MLKLLAVFRWKDFHQREVGGWVGGEGGRWREWHGNGGRWSMQLSNCVSGWPAMQGASLFSPAAPLLPLRLHHFLITDPWKQHRSFLSSHTLTPYCSCICNQSPPPSFKSLSTYYPYSFLPLLLSSDRASKPSQQVLVAAACFSSMVTPSLSPRCPSTTLTALLSLSVKPYMSQNG